MTFDDRNLFSADLPLPEKLRPADFDTFFGQQHIVKKLQDRPLHSLILYGPPGCGKTSLARLLAKQSGRSFHFLSAVSCGIKEVRDIIDIGRRSGSVVLFLDEIHRFNKSQQDALLHAVEEGLVILIGATTENPSFEIIGPLLSRCQVYRLHPLQPDDLSLILDQGLAECERNIGVEIDRDSFHQHARQNIIDASGGDARSLLRFLEILIDESKQAQSAINKDDERSSKSIRIEPHIVNEVLSGKIRFYGQDHYDIISAFIKSLRGSDADASLLYLAVMIDGGEDPLFIARRMIIFAAEDIGNASPTALTLAVSAFQAVERIGMPEGRIVLAQCATFLAASPKSNASYIAIDQALEFVKGKTIQVPNHLRNAPTLTQKNEGAGKDYKYPHDFDDHFVHQNYFPENIEQQFYRPTMQGQEARIAERLRKLFPSRL